MILKAFSWRRKFIVYSHEAFAEKNVFTKTRTPMGMTFA
jgi:hypothetical protein